MIVSAASPCTFRATKYSQPGPPDEAAGGKNRRSYVAQTGMLKKPAVSGAMSRACSALTKSDVRGWPELNASWYWLAASYLKSPTCHEATEPLIALVILKGSLGRTEKGSLHPCGVVGMRFWSLEERRGYQQQILPGCLGKTFVRFDYARIKYPGHSTRSVADGECSKIISILQAILAVVLIDSLLLNVAICVFNSYSIWHIHDKHAGVDPCETSIKVS